MPVTTNTRKLAALLGASGAGIGTDGLMQPAGIDADMASQAELDESDNRLTTNLAVLAIRQAADHNDVKYNLQDRIIDDYYNASGIDATPSTNHTLTAGVYGGDITNTATGGTIIEPGAYTGGLYRSHTFLIGNTGQSFTPAAAMNVDLLVVAGGGGGGGEAYSAGGGAGGFRTATSVALTAQAYTITVGDGGTGGVGQGGGGTSSNGGNSSFGSVLISTGGGGGGSYTATDGGDGGSGGGGGRYSGSTAGAGNAGSFSPVEGYAGGNGTNTGGSGGGGSSGVGVSATNNVGGNGGPGTANYYRDGNSSGTTVGTHLFAGGGGGAGACAQGSPCGYGLGVAGGGNGNSNGGSPSGNTAEDGADNSGSGGGGAEGDGSTDPDGGEGGSGIVVIRYLVSGGVGDMTLQSTDTEAETQPTKADMVMLVEDAGSGVGTVNTHIKGHISRDSGTTFTEGVLVDEGDWGTDKRILAFHDLDISGQPADQTMCYKITTHSASAVYDTKIHAASIGWK